jgi:hemerythrin superfamily protein
MAENDVIAVLTHDHHELEGLFGALTATTDLRERRRILDDVTIEVVWHAVAEEVHLYPAVRRRVPGGDAIVDKKLSADAALERLLEHLQEADVTDAAFMRLVRRLIHDVEEHVREEENVLFPRLAEHSSPDDLLRLGRQVESATSTAPTRCGAGDRPVLNKILAPGEGLVDRARDEVCGRTRATRPRTPRTPAANDQSSMWPDAWAAHRHP